MRPRASSLPTRPKMGASTPKISSASVPVQAVEAVAAASACVPSARVSEGASKQHSLMHEPDVSSSESLNRLHENHFQFCPVSFTKLFL